jgi:hypothetical protein
LEVHLKGSDMSDQTKLELICKSGHKSEHLRDRVLRHQDAWCPKCGADIEYIPDSDDGAVPKAA